MADEDLIATLEREGKWMELVKALAQHAETAPASEQAALHLKIATIYNGRFANLVEAIKSYERVLAVEPDHRKALDALRAIYEKRRDWEKLLELEKGELGRTPPEKRADKAIDVARLASTRVSNPNIQLYWWERVLEHEPDHRQAFTELTKLYAHRERWTDLATILRRQADVAEGNDDLAAALRKLAAVQDSCLNARAEAVATMQLVADLDPADAVTKRVLVELRADQTIDWSAHGFVGVELPLASPSAASSIGSTSTGSSSTGASPTRSSSNVASPATPPARSSIKWLALGAVAILAAGGIYFALQ